MLFLSLLGAFLLSLMSDLLVLIVTPSVPKRLSRPQLENLKIMHFCQKKFKLCPINLKNSLISTNCGPESPENLFGTEVVIRRLTPLASLCSVTGDGNSN